jgi:hypothetical protein
MGEGRGKLAPNARSQLAAFAGCGDTYLERAISVGGEQGECGQVRGISYVDRNAETAAYRRNMCT